MQFWMWESRVLQSLRLSWCFCDDKIVIRVSAEMEAFSSLLVELFTFSNQFQFEVSQGILRMDDRFAWLFWQEQSVHLACALAKVSVFHKYY